MARYHVFVSHAWKYSEDYYDVIHWFDEAKNAGYFDYANYSVPRHDPLIDPSTTYGKAALKEALKRQIAPASSVIIISGMYATYSEWIDYELETAYAMNKHIIGLRPWNQERVPLKVQQYADVIVGWNRDPLIREIRVQQS